MKIKVITNKEVSYLKIEAPVRYDDEDMPFDAPMRVENDWIVYINLDEKWIVDWPAGKTLKFFMKVCDCGIYTLYDSSINEIVKKEGYVPNNLLPGEYGDYLELDIDENGIIKNWLPNANLSDFENPLLTDE